MQNTAQRFDDENALMSSCFFNLEDDIFEYERHAIRMHLIRNANSINAIATLNAVSSVESTTRAAEDVEVLDTVIETQKLLQQMVRREKNPLRPPVFAFLTPYYTLHFYFILLYSAFAPQVLLHFGTQHDKEGDDPDAGFPTMDKLNQRMAKVNEKKNKK